MNGMKEEILFVIRRNHDGYGVWEADVKDGQVVYGKQIAEYDFLMIMAQKLVNHIKNFVPDTLKPSTRKDEALPVKDEKEPETKTVDSNGQIIVLENK